MNEGERVTAIALALCSGLERRSLNKLIAGLQSPIKVWEANADQWLAACRLHNESLSALSDWRSRQDPVQLKIRVEDQGIQMIVRGDDLYPEKLLQWGQSAPLVLFLRGNPNLLTNIPAISVVGTRRASAYGLEAARWLATSLAAAGVSVVSGLALGVDGAAHRAALSAGGATIAVLGSGVNICYPPSHRELFQQIEKRGLIMSEYPPDAAVAKHHFPERNRIIAALGNPVVIVQAGEKSGALSTVDYALELGRDVYVVPGPITSKLFRGSNQLLKDGAQPVLDPADLLAQSNLQLVSRESSRPQRWAQLYEILESAAGASELASLLNMPLKIVYAALMELELDGWIKRVPGGLYARKTI